MPNEFTLEAAKSKRSGVTLLRAAAKNHARVTVLSDPNDYPDFLQELGKNEKGDISEKSRQQYALKVG